MTLKIAPKKTLLQNTPILKMFFWKFSINMDLSKKKILRFNDNPFMIKSLRKAIMHTAKLKIIYIKQKQMIKNKETSV